MRSLTISLTIVMALSVYAAVDATPAAPTGANVGAASRVAIPWGPKAHGHHHAGRRHRLFYLPR